jgi:hypothetical protein
VNVAKTKKRTATKRKAPRGFMLVPTNVHRVRTAVPRTRTGFAPREPDEDEGPREAFLTLRMHERERVGIHRQAQHEGRTAVAYLVGLHEAHVARASASRKRRAPRK